jgi:hypothetical protein
MCCEKFHKLSLYAMRRPVLLIFINAMILIVVFCLMTQSLVIIQRIARTETVTGRVEVQHKGKSDFKALSQGDMIKTGDVIRSGIASTAEFKWADGTRWKIMPQTEIVVKKSTRNAIQKADQSQLKLNAGKVFIRIVKALKPASQFEVETPTAVAAVRGTIFSVEVKGGVSEVAVFKGRVAVHSNTDGNNTEQDIEPGRSAVSNAPGDLREQDDTQAAREFAAEKTIVLPELAAEIETTQNGTVWVKGRTESGDEVQVNGKPVMVLGNGVFRKKIELTRPDQLVEVVATDKHGAQSTQIVNGKIQDSKAMNTPGHAVCLH